MSGADIFIGLMSGTSADAIDAVMTRFKGDGAIETIASHSKAMPEGLKVPIFALQSGASRDIYDVCRLDAELAQHYADSVDSLIAKTSVERTDIAAIGNHGQTLLHRPDDNPAFTLQIGDNHRLAELTGIQVVGDFRRRDIAAGGQAAPLIPAFHKTLVAPKESAAFLNIGGIANISCIKQGEASGFDTGPGNTLMDAWIRRHKGLDFDRSGTWARAGSLDEKLLKAMLADPYFHKAAPKSSGQDHFNLAWLSALLTDSPAPEDVQRTLLELTAVTTSAALRQSGSQSVFIFGGGRHNDFLMARIQDLLGGLSVSPTNKLGVDPDFMEATAFAWLAKQCLDGKPGNDPAVTGARGERVLGVVFPA